MWLMGPDNHQEILSSSTILQKHSNAAGTMAFQSRATHASQNESATKATWQNQRPRWGGSRRYQLPHILRSWKPVEESLTAGIQPTWSLPVTFLQNWCNWVTMANGDGNNDYWWHIPVYRQVSNPAALYIQASALHTWKALYKDSAVLDRVCFIDLAGVQEGEWLSSSLKTQLLQL